MARMLTRSKSLRFLRGNHKAREYEDDVLPPKASQTELDRYFTASPILKSERNLEALDIAARPGTSDGLSDRSTKMFHLKSLNDSPSVHTHDHGIDCPSCSKPPNVLYTAEVTTGSGVIGIALGSPTTGSHWDPTPQSSTSKLDLSIDDSLPATKRTPPWESSYQEPPKPKLSRWKSLFKKIPPPPPSAPQKPTFYSVVTTVTAAGRATSHDDNESLRSQVSSRKEKEWTRTVSPPFYKPDIRESRKGNVVESSVSRPQTRGRAVTAPTSAVPEVVVLGSTNDAASSSIGGRLLDVSIPDIKMERYSVMFSSLLQPNANQPSSLLARRQGLTEKLKPLDELAIKEELPIDDKIPYTATGPTAVSQSPRLSLFPSANSSRVSSPRTASAARTEKRLQRSMTAPAKSPLRQTFSQATLDEQKKRGAASSVKSKSGPGVKPPEHPPRIDSFEYQKELAVKPLKGVKQETAAYRVPVSVASITTLPPKAPKYPPRSDSHRQPQVTKMSALSSHPSSSPVDGTSPLQRLQSLSSPTGSARKARSKGGRVNGKKTMNEMHDIVTTAPRPEIGIARSVSLSRANKPRTPVRTMTNPSSARSPVAERLIDRRALTPTMVEVGNRQSHRVQLVDL